MLWTIIAVALIGGWVFLLADLPVSEEAAKGWYGHSLLMPSSSLRATVARPEFLRDG